ncbi:putative transmembrane protein, partial [Toxoplasma gondii CAST]
MEGADENVETMRQQLDYLLDLVRRQQVELKSYHAQVWQQQRLQEQALYFQQRPREADHALGQDSSVRSVTLRRRMSSSSRPYRSGSSMPRSASPSLISATPSDSGPLCFPSKFPLPAFLSQHFLPLFSPHSRTADPARSSVPARKDKRFSDRDGVEERKLSSVSSLLSPAASVCGRRVSHSLLSRAATPPGHLSSSRSSENNPSQLLLVLRSMGSGARDESHALLGSERAVLLRLQQYLVNKLRGHPVLRVVSEVEACSRDAKKSFSARLARGFPLSRLLFRGPASSDCKSKFVVVTADSEKLLLVLEEMGGLKLTADGVFFAPYRSACRVFFKGGRKDSRLFLTPNEAVELMRSELFAMRFGADAPYPSLQGLSVLEVCIAAGVVEDFFPLHQPRLLAVLQAKASNWIGSCPQSLCRRRRAAEKGGTSPPLCSPMAVASAASYDVLVAAYFGYPAAAFTLFGRWIRRLLVTLLLLSLAGYVLRRLVPAMLPLLDNAAKEAMSLAGSSNSAPGTPGAGVAGVRGATVAAVAAGAVTEVLRGMVDSPMVFNGFVGIAVCLFLLIQLKRLTILIPIFRYTLGLSTLPPFASFASSSSSLASASPFSSLLFFEWPVHALRQKVEALLAFAASPSERLSFAAHPLFRRAFLKQSSRSTRVVDNSAEPSPDSYQAECSQSASEPPARRVPVIRELTDGRIETRENADPVFSSRSSSPFLSIENATRLGLYICLYLVIFSLCLAGLGFSLLPGSPDTLALGTVLRSFLTQAPLLKWLFSPSYQIFSVCSCRSRSRAGAGVDAPCPSSVFPAVSWALPSTGAFRFLAEFQESVDVTQLCCGLAENAHLLFLSLVFLLLCRVAAYWSSCIGRKLVGIRLPEAAPLSAETVSRYEGTDLGNDGSVRQPDVVIKSYLEVSSLFFSVSSLALLLLANQALDIPLSTALLAFVFSFTLDVLFSLLCIGQFDEVVPSLPSLDSTSARALTPQFQAFLQPFSLGLLYRRAFVLLLLLPLAAVHGSLVPFLVLSLAALILQSVRARREILVSRRAFSGSGKSFADILDLWLPILGSQLILLLVAVASSTFLSLTLFVTHASVPAAEGAASVGEAKQGQTGEELLSGWSFQTLQATILAILLSFVSWSVPPTTSKLRIVLEMAERDLSAHEFGFAVRRDEAEETTALTCRLVGLPSTVGQPSHLPFFTRFLRCFFPPLLILSPPPAQPCSRTGRRVAASLFEASVLHKMTLTVFGLAAHAAIKDEGADEKSDEAVPHVDTRQLSAATDQYIASLPRSPGSAALTAVALPSSTTETPLRERTEDTKK